MSDDGPAMVIAQAAEFDIGERCESCGRHVVVGQRIQRWADGVRTHYDCDDRAKYFTDPTE